MKRGIRVKISSYTRHHVNITMTQAKGGEQLHQLHPGQHGGHRKTATTKPCCWTALVSSAKARARTCSSSRTAWFTRPTCRPAPGRPLNGINPRRNTILHICQDLGLKLVEKRITRDEVYISDEAFFTGTAAEVTPIRELDPHRDRQRLARAHHRADPERLLRHRQTGATRSTPTWLTLV